MTGWAHSSLKGRVALLTGASGGIGKAIAQRLADVGADLEDPGTAATLVERAETELGAIDILVANAGTAHQTDWQNIDLDLWHKTLTVNLTTPFLLAQRVLPGMVERRFGRVLFMSSVAALNGGLVGAHYAASKAGLHGLTHHLAPRVAASGVTVNALAPALIGQTRMLPIDPDTGDAPLPIPVGRLGRPGEVADMAVAMLSNAYLTDKVVTLDGGLIPR